jgi:flavorubredoxin
LYAEIDAAANRREKAMSTRIDEIAEGIYRLSTFVPEIAPPAGFTFNQFLILADEPLLFHTGHRRMFPQIRDAVARLMPPPAHGETIDLGGGRKVRYLDTPHTPHAWDAGMLFEEATGTLFCGDLFTQVGDEPALTESDIVGPAIAGEDLFRYSSLHPNMGATIRTLVGLAPRTLALMHGPSFAGDGAAALRALADDYDGRAAGLQGMERIAA